MLPIYEAMHKVHTHLLTEESLGFQPLLKVLTRVSSLIGSSYGIAKEKGGVQMGREEVHRQAFAKIKETLANAPVMVSHESSS